MEGDEKGDNMTIRDTKQVHKTIFSIFILSILLILAQEGWGSDSSLKQVVLNVEGMTCSSCPAMIKMAMRKLDGVVSADVSYKEAKATVKYQEGKVTVEQIIKTIEGIWFKASLFERGK